jgi:hypothetical protein
VGERPPVIKPKKDRRRHPRIPVQTSPHDQAFERRRHDEASRQRQARIEAEREDDPSPSALFEHAVC